MNNVVFLLSKFWLLVSALDDIGHGVRSNTPSSKARGSSQGSIQSLSALNNSGHGSSTHVGPAPTTKPPTPPSVIRATGSLSKGSREYRTPPAVAPPQVTIKFHLFGKDSKNTEKISKAKLKG